jgi:Protein of unknown function (DUF1329)
MKKKPLGIALALAFCVTAASLAQAAVPADEAKQLGGKLTAFGAEAAGNADGAIPAYTGGEKPPASFKPGSNVRPNPYAGEKPLFSIKPADGAKYADKLTAGAREMLKRHADFRMDVYKTHRSVNFPSFVLANTAKNAVEAKTADGGLALEGYRAGVAFPIPKTGNEVLWNHLTRFGGLSFTAKYDVVNIDRNGKSALSTGGYIIQEFPAYDPATAGKVLTGSDIFYQTKIMYKEPARRSGEALIVKDFIDPIKNKRRAWQYLPGQRRVKESPEVAYDTPNATTAGNTTYDDSFLYNGAMDRFEMKLVGKKEMYIPYNTYDWTYGDKSKTMDTPKFFNPDHLRWELHRVWVVEGTLKPGMRHVYAKRVFYVDEDSWTVLATDMYDARGDLYRAGFAGLAPAYDQNVPNALGLIFYDFVSGGYTISGLNAGEYGGVKFHPRLPANDWAPDSLAGSGIR